MFFKPEVVTRVLIVLSIFAVESAFDPPTCWAQGWQEEVQETNRIIEERLSEPAGQVVARGRILRNIRAICDRVANDFQWAGAKEAVYSILNQNLDWTNQDEWILENWFLEGSAFEHSPPSFKYYGVLNKGATKTSLGKLVPKHLGSWIQATPGWTKKKGATFVPLTILPKMLENLNGVLVVIRGLDPQGSLDEKSRTAGERIRPLFGNFVPPVLPVLVASSNIVVNPAKVPSFSSLLEMAEMADRVDGESEKPTQVKREREEGGEVASAPQAESSVKQAKSEVLDSELQNPPTMVRVTLASPPVPEAAPESAKETPHNASQNTPKETSLKFLLMSTKISDEDLLKSIQDLCGDSSDVCIVGGRPVSMLLALYQLRGFDAVQSALRRSLFNLEHKMIPSDPMTVGDHLISLALASSGPIRTNALVADSGILMEENARINRAIFLLDNLLEKVASPDHFRAFLATYEALPSVHLALKARLQENFKLAILKNEVANISWWIHSGLVNLKE